MRTRRTATALIAAVLFGLVMTGASPAHASDSPSAAQRIADLFGRTFATASDTSSRVTMQPPVTIGGYQHWTFTASSSTYQVTNAATRGCLAGPKVWFGVNPPVIQRPCDGAALEQWELVRNPDFRDTYMFRNVALRRCMGIEPISASNAANLHLYSCDQLASNQQFRLA